MGVPKFYRYICERYPCIQELIKESQDFDNLYLDMNGIIHMCSHPEDENQTIEPTEEEIFNNIFHYVEALFYIIKPRKLLFLAVDGVAPRAKMNQQRGRRFKSAKEKAALAKKLISEGNISQLPRFDPNCITPGTKFMVKLQKYLEYFVASRLSTNEQWQKCKVILSGHQVPGEGEHKIVEFIRHMKTQPDYDPYTRHCLYGLDADLLILGLCTHEKYFSILREEVIFGRKTNRVPRPEETKFYLTHLSLLREYLDLEFQDLKKDLPFEYNIESIIDDWAVLAQLLLPHSLELRTKSVMANLLKLNMQNRNIVRGASHIIKANVMSRRRIYKEYSRAHLMHARVVINNSTVLMGFILGNDFIPHLPDFHIAKGAIPLLYKTYTEVLPTLSGYLNENGYLNLSRFHMFMEKLAKHEMENFEENYSPLFYGNEKSAEKPNSDEGNKKESKSDTLGTMDEAASATQESTDDSEGTESGEGEVEVEVEDGTDDGDVAQQFTQYKRDYYTTKMHYSNVTEEVLRSQAEGYVRGLQWILHYYYHGCKSWSWFYPHHYAPCTSDIVNFKDVNLDFELGKPFLPYEQLMAVLPPGSKDLLPKAYQGLMMSPDSPIKEYYPEDFETDLNGKQHEWEAIVLLPLINESVLLDAMENCNHNLTGEEKSNNKHGPMLIYSYTSENLGTYKAPKYFKCIYENHALAKSVWRDEIAVNISQLQEMRNTSDFKYLSLRGFPTLKSLTFQASKKVGKIKVFNYPAKTESVILSITLKKTKGLEKVAKELLGETVHINWPFLNEARVVGISDKSIKYTMDDAGLIRNELSEEEKNNWNQICNTMRLVYAETRGIEIGSINFMVYVCHLMGIHRSYDSNGKMCTVKVWSEKIELLPAQMVVRNFKFDEPNHVELNSTNDIFPVGSVVFMLTYPYYGCRGVISGSADKGRKNRLAVEVEVTNESYIDLDRMHRTTVPYFTGNAASKRIGVSVDTIGKLSGSILIDVPANESPTRKRHTVNIGLLLRYNKSTEKVPGYTLKDVYWKYSGKAVDLMREYTERYPHVVEYISRHAKEFTSYPKSDIFPGPEGYDELTEIVQWIKSLESSQIPHVSYKSETLESDTVANLEKVVDRCFKKRSTVKVFVKPQQLFKSDLTTGDVPPVQTNDHKLFDRVICVRPYHTVPVGRKGYIIGIIKGEAEDEDKFDVLFDEPLPMAMPYINCSPGRGYRMAKASVINISHGERVAKPMKQPNGQPISKNRRPIGKTELASRKGSNSNPSSVPKDESEQFKNLWSSLEKGKAKEIKDNAKQCLDRKEEERKAKEIEDNAKQCLHNHSKNAEKFKPDVKKEKSQIKNLNAKMKDLSIETRGSKRSMEKSVSAPGARQKTMSQMNMSGDKEDMCAPCQTKAADRRGDVVKGLFQLIRDETREAVERRWKQEREKQPEEQQGQRENQQKNYSLEDIERDDDNTEIEHKPIKGSFEGLERESSETFTMPGTDGDKAPRSTSPQYQCHRVADIPYLLPTPPVEWYRQCNYENTYPDQYTYYNAPRTGDSKVCPEQWNQNYMNWNLSSNYQNGNWRQNNTETNYQTYGGSDYIAYNYSFHVPSEAENQDPSIFRGVNFEPNLTYPFQQESQNATEDYSQPGPSRHVLTATAPEFVPLQCLNRNRHQLPNQPSGVQQVTGEGQEAGSVAHSSKSFAGPDKDTSLSPRDQRRAKIAANFDFNS